MDSCLCSTRTLTSDRRQQHPQHFQKPKPGTCRAPTEVSSNRQSHREASVKRFCRALEGRWGISTNGTRTTVNTKQSCFPYRSKKVFLHGRGNSLTGLKERIKTYKATHQLSHISEPEIDLRIYSFSSAKKTNLTNQVKQSPELTSKILLHKVSVENKIKWKQVETTPKPSDNGWNGWRSTNENNVPCIMFSLSLSCVIMPPEEMNFWHKAQHEWIWKYAKRNKPSHKRRNAAGLH